MIILIFILPLLSICLTDTVKLNRFDEVKDIYMNTDIYMIFLYNFTIDNDTVLSNTLLTF